MRLSRRKFSKLLGASALSLASGGFWHGQVALPAGAIGIWYGDQCSALAVPNAASPGNANATLGAGAHCTGGFFNVSSPGTLTWNSAQSYSAMTVMAIARQTSAGVTGTFLRETNHNQFSAYMSDAGTISPFIGLPQPAVYFGGSQIEYNFSGLWNLNGASWHCITHVYDGTQFQCWLDDMKLLDSITAGGFNQTYPGLTSTSWSDFELGAPGYDFACVVLWNRTLSAAEIRSAYNALVAHVAPSGISIAFPSNVLVTEGDSLTWSSYPFTYGQNHPTWFGDDAAVPGSKLKDVPGQPGTNTVTFRLPITDAIIPQNKAGRRFIFSCFIGANDLQAYQNLATPTLCATQYAADLVTLFQGRKAAGYDKCVAITLLPRCDNGFAAFNTYRDILNPIMTGAGWGAPHVDAVVNFGGNATMGPDAACSDTSLYSDGVHPTAAGDAILAPIYDTVISAL